MLENTKYLCCHRIKSSGDKNLKLPGLQWNGAPVSKKEPPGPGWVQQLLNPRSALSAHWSGDVRAACLCLISQYHSLSKTIESHRAAAWTESWRHAFVVLVANLMDHTLCRGIVCCSVCVCVCVQPRYLLCARWAGLLFPVEWERMFYAVVVYICTNAQSSLRPIMGEKVPPPTTTIKKKPLSAPLSLKSPKEKKKKGKKGHTLPPLLPGALGSSGSARVSPTTELCLDRNQCATHRIGIFAKPTAPHSHTTFSLPLSHGTKQPRHSSHCDNNPALTLRTKCTTLPFMRITEMLCIFFPNKVHSVHDNQLFFFLFLWT